MNDGIGCLTDIGTLAHSCPVEPERHKASRQQVVAVQSREGREAPLQVQKQQLIANLYLSAIAIWLERMQAAHTKRCGYVVSKSY